MECRFPWRPARRADLALVTVAATLVTIAATMVAVTAAFAGGSPSSGGVSSSPAAGQSTDRFPVLRARVQAWLSNQPVEERIIAPMLVKRTIVDDWETQRSRYQLVSVRQPQDDSLAGHIPHSINVSWPALLDSANLARIDSSRTLVLSCYYGHASMLCCTILGLLGYRCLSVGFGMMGWNLSALVKPPWDQESDYPVESGPGSLQAAAYALPVLESKESDPRAVVRQRAEAYFGTQGSPVIEAAKVKSILDDWDRRKSEYQIVSVESKEAYAHGHVPHALDIPLSTLADSASLRALDPAKTTIAYSDNGQTGQCAATVLNLLGYKAVAMKFGMMDWNRSCVADSMLWHGAPGFPVEEGRD